MEKAELLKAKTIKQNQKLLNKTIKVKQIRHVKEQNEPIFDSYLKSFRLKYGKNVVMNSANEILKELKDEI